MNDGSDPGRLSAWLASTTMAIALLPAGAAQASLFLSERGDTALQVKAESENPALVDRQTSVEAPDSTTTFRTLVEIAGLGFGKHIDRGPFASAVVSAAHAGGVGADGFFFGKNIHLSAERQSRDSITNVDTLPFTSDFVYDIEPIDVGVFPGDGIRGMDAGILVLATMERFHDGVGSGIETLVDYNLRVSKPRFGDDDDAFDIERTQDLLADAGDGTPIDTGGLFGVHYDGFRGSRSLGTLQPGDTIVVDYLWRAFVLTGDTPEIAGEAFIGDPFDLTGTGGAFGFVIGDDLSTPAPGGTVPEPHTAGLMAIGVALLRLARHTKERKGASTERPVA